MLIYIYEKDGRKRIAKEVTCENCDKRFLKAKRFIKESHQNFCSTKCYSESRKIEKIKFNSKYNYRTYAFRYYGGKCEICGYCKHPEILQVHHIDGDRKNNKIENLIVLCPNHHWAITLKKAILLKNREFKWLMGTWPNAKAPDLHSGN